MSFPVSALYNPVPLADLPADIQQRAVRTVRERMPPPPIDPPVWAQSLDTLCNLTDTASGTPKSSSDWPQAPHPPAAAAAVSERVLEGYRIYAPTKNLVCSRYLSIYRISLWGFYNVVRTQVCVHGVISTQQELEKMCANSRDTRDRGRRAQKEVEDTLDGLPEEVLAAIANLIDSRKAATWSQWTTRKWHVVHVQEQPRTRLTPSDPSDLKKRHKFRWWMNGAAEKLPREYFVILEGTMEQMDMSGGIRKFDEHSNPWASADWKLAEKQRQSQVEVRIGTEEEKEEDVVV